MKVAGHHSNKLLSLMDDVIRCQPPYHGTRSLQVEGVEGLAFSHAQMEAYDVCSLSK